MRVASFSFMTNAALAVTPWLWVLDTCLTVVFASTGICQHGKTPSLQRRGIRPLSPASCLSSTNAARSLGRGSCRKRRRRARFSRTAAPIASSRQARNLRTECVPFRARGAVPRITPTVHAKGSPSRW
ncbi:unnamed protein product [Ectocarpus sp. 12 AP-2014]